MMQIKFTVLVLLLTAFGCGGGTSSANNSATSGTTEVAGIFSSADPSRAIMANSSGEVLTTTTDLKSVVLTDLSGGSVTVYLDTSGLPTQMVIDNFIYLFKNWNTTANTVDVVEIYPSTQYVKVTKGASVTTVFGQLSAGQTLKSGLFAETSCAFDNTCPTPEKRLAELFRVGSIGISAAACVALAVETAGLGYFACSSALVSEAKYLVGNESWLNQLDKLGNVLLAKDLYSCGSSADVVSCYSAILDFQNKILQNSTTEVSSNNDLLANAWVGPPGGVQGAAPPVCPTINPECSPGSYLPCLSGGTKQCSTSCSWGTCPNSTPSPNNGGSSSSFQGSYPTGSYSGNCTATDSLGATGPVNGSASMTIDASGNISVTTDVGSGTGTVKLDGGATFGAGAGYNFTGSFTAGSGGSGSWTATVPDETCSGTWSVQ